MSNFVSFHSFLHWVKTKLIYFIMFLFCTESVGDIFFFGTFFHWHILGLMVLGHFGLKNQTRKTDKIHNNFELYQVFMCQAVLKFPTIYIIYKKNWNILVQRYYNILNYSKCWIILIIYIGKKCLKYQIRKTISSLKIFQYSQIVYIKSIAQFKSVFFLVSFLLT